MILTSFLSERNMTVLALAEKGQVYTVQDHGILVDGAKQNGKPN